MSLFTNYWKAMFCLIAHGHHHGYVPDGMHRYAWHCDKCGHDWTEVE